MPQAPQPKDGQYLWLDPHILCTPTLADIDGDGHEDLVVAATYFFDRDEYDSQVCSTRTHAPEDDQQAIRL